MRTVVALLCVLAVAFAAELLGGENAKAIPGSYIIVMKDGITSAGRDAHIVALLASAAGSSSIVYKYDIPSFIGFAANLSPEMLKAELAHDDVAYVEVDQIMSISATTQNGATWGLDRIDQVNLPVSSSYTYNTSGGSGATVYVIDTGIYIQNRDFGGRAVNGYNAITNEAPGDMNGHGTHCAGTIGGALYGVAKNVRLVGVKVLSASGSGTNAGVIAGVNNVTAEKRVKGGAIIASMSLGGGVSVALDQAVTSSIATGIPFAVAAGNDASNACNYSPARTPNAVTVGATASTDHRASYSNFGTCVDIFAPGSSITSDWIGSPSAINTISGTSMATPHVAGVIAVHLAQYPSTTPAQISAWLAAAASTGKVVSPGTGSPNLLLFSPFV